MAIHALKKEFEPAALHDELNAQLEAMRNAYLAQPNPDVATRRTNLRKLRDMIVDNEAAIIEAISADFSFRSPTETRLVETLPTVMGIKDALRHVGRWMKSERRSVHPALWLAKARVDRMPLGVVGIVAPWNYPLQLSLAPLTAALAAGNRAMIKPSEATPRFSELLAELVAKTFDSDHVTVVTGGPDVAAAFTKLRFDHIFFTGSTRIGTIVAKAAAENLVPVTLELGGKSPTVIDKGTALTDKLIGSLVWGKFVNAGQTCVAPDYILVHESERDHFVERFMSVAKSMYGGRLGGDGYTAMINDAAHGRMQELCDDAAEHGATLRPLDELDDTAKDELGRKFMPTLVLDPTAEMRLLQEEIFGPILPIRTYSSHDDAIETIRRHDRPLALYVYTDDPMVADRYRRDVISGGMCINSCVVHVGVESLPFGGVGQSGTGRYHGRDGFECMSHPRAVFEQKNPNGAHLILPPYKGLVDTLINKLVGAKKTPQIDLDRDA